MTSKIEAYGPAVWKELIGVCSSIYGAAVIAGGAPRDWIIGKDRPKDIDIFVPTESEFEFGLTLNDLRDVGFLDSSMMTKGGDYDPTEGEVSNILGVFEAKWFTNDYTYLPINVIAKPPEKVADINLLWADFDYNLCQFTVDNHDFGVVASDAANKALDNGIIEVYNDDPRTTQRVKRFLDKNENRKRFTWPDEPKTTYLSNRYSYFFSGERWLEMPRFGGIVPRGIQGAQAQMVWRDELGDL